MTVPYAFGSATSAIPLSQLDANFNTPITLGNTAIQLGNTVTTLNNMTLANVTITSGTINASFSNANAVVYTNASNVATTSSALTFDGSIVTNTGVGFSADNANALYRFRSAAGVRTAYLQARADAFDIWSDQAAVPMVFGVANSEGMRLTSTGLGIGTSSPSEKLTVAATANNAGKFTSTATTTALVLDNTNANGWGSNIAINTGGVAAGYFGTIGSLLGSTAQDLAVYANTGNGFRVYTNGNNERLRLDSSGNLGLGVTPSAWGSGYKAYQNLKSSWFSTSSRDANFGTNVYVDAVGYKYIDTAAASLYTQYQGAHSWYYAASGTAGNAITFTQAMTLDASGNLALTKIALNSDSPFITGANISSGANPVALGTTGSANIHFFTNNTERARITSSGDFLVGVTVINNAGGLSVHPGTAPYCTLNKSLTGTQDAFYFEYNGAIVGKITYSDTATAYVTSSDYRLKDNQQPLTGSGAFIDALQPKTWEWKTDGTKGVGFIAHEVQAVSPSSVVGEKDAVDEEGKPIMQCMEYGSAEFIANIIAELQSLRARVAQLEAK